MNKFFLLFLTIFLLVNLKDEANAQDLRSTPSRVVKAKYFDKTPPLRDMKVILPGERDRSWKDNIIGNKSMEVNLDKQQNLRDVNPPETQTYFGSQNTRGPIYNFPGIGNVNGVFPPDTDGDVGLDHYFQMINLSYAIWDKEGNLLYGPVDNSTLWQGFIGPWTGTNDGDPIVLYDEEADRWVASQFAVNLPNGKSYELVAVSETGDPLGSYYRYAFEFDAMNDYPKLGVWRDGYYSTYHMFSGGYAGAAIGVFERDKMLEGDPDASMIYFGEYGSIFGLLPADFDGDQPPEGSPNYIMDIVDNGIKIYKVEVDWDTPSNSSFTLDASLTPNSFSSGVNGIKQPNTSTKLDDLAAMLMNRLQYRNFGTYETMVANHTIAFYGRSAVRWYEFRRTGGEWSIYQQGTYSPDPAYRWMGSIAMNGHGEIALGYSVSSSDIYPSVRYTGRSADAELGEMNYDEMEVVSGKSSQSGISRWGDYACMSVDPEDDSTFWFTQEYRKAGNWGTWITSFNFEDPVAPVISAGNDDTVCEYSYFNPQATAKYQKSVLWETRGDGIFVDPESLKTTYAHGSDDLDSGQVTLLLTAYGFSDTLVSKDSLILYISEKPDALAGNDTTICHDEVLQLQGNALNYSSVKWMTEGDGNFADSTVLNTVYTPGENDINNGGTELTLIAYPQEPCVDEDDDDLELTIDECTNIGELSPGLSFEITPNPSDGVFMLNISGYQNSDIKISIMNLQGQVLFTQQMGQLNQSLQKQIDMSNFPAGTYLFSIENDQDVVTRKIVLN